MVLVMCGDCGYTYNPHVHRRCPKCGSKNISIVVDGYRREERRRRRR